MAHLDFANIHDPTSEDLKQSQLPFGITVKGENGGLGVEDGLTYGESVDMAQTLQAMGLPTSFGGALSVSSSKKANRKHFFCELCLTELNSEETINSHLQGANHLRKLQAFRSKQKKGETVTPTAYLNQYSDLAQLPKKKPPKLRSKLTETSQPIVGLKYITEIIACSNAEMDPLYECLLCKVLDGSENMLTHVLSRRHRVNYLEARFRKDFHEMSHANLEQEVEMFKENDNLELMQTLYSDEQYPWPPGTAPWSIEKGGSGILPTFGRDNAEERKEGINDHPTERLIVKGLPIIINENDLKSHLSQAQALIERSVRYHRLRVAMTGDELEDLEVMEKQMKEAIKLLGEVKIKQSLRGSVGAPTFKVRLGSESSSLPGGRFDDRSHSRDSRSPYSRNSRSPPRSPSYSRKRRYQERSVTPDLTSRRQSRRERSVSPEPRMRHNYRERSVSPECGKSRYRNNY